MKHDSEVYKKNDGSRYWFTERFFTAACGVGVFFFSYHIKDQMQTERRKKNTDRQRGKEGKNKKT